VNDVALIVAVLVVAIGGLAGVAYLLDRRRQASGAVGPEIPPPGPIGRALLWTVRALVVIMVLSLVGFFVSRVMALVWVAAGCLLAYLVVGGVYRIVRLAGR
jgi:hypothetical protein